VLAAASEIGLDTDRLERDMEAPGVEQILRSNYDIAGRLAIDGTPAFVIGDEIVGGAIELEELQAKVKAARGS
jgi:protein-disulfide isomerase